MGILSWITGKHFDEQPDPDDEHANDPYWSDNDTEEDNRWIGTLAKRRDAEIAANPTPYGAGQAGARMQIDDMRRYWHQYGASSFREAVEVTGKYWHHIVQVEQELIDQGYPERQEYLEYARGARSMFD